MNPKVEYENRDYERVRGKHGLRLSNDNGERLCEMCDLNGLVITRLNTVPTQDQPQSNTGVAR